jgi:pyruvate formate lyase activating enzyme
MRTNTGSPGSTEHEAVEAILWTALSEGKVRCNLCSHRCIIASGRRGVCQVRENRNGTLYSLVFGRAIAQHLDPIEKKPLFHFYPGSSAYSVATRGCNFKCEFCQNWQISQQSDVSPLAWGEYASPETLVQSARRAGARSIAYTYTEPTIFAEYALATARLAREQGIANVFVTNGFMTPELLDILGESSSGAGPLLDAANVDLKAGRGEFYQKLCGGRLEPVLDNLRLMRDMGVWLEVTTLVIPGINDTDEELRWVADFIASDLGLGIPWHVSRFHPQHRLAGLNPTPAATLERAREIGIQAGLHHVYVGNLPGQGWENTICSNCGKTIIRRIGYQILQYRMRDGRCEHCDTPVLGVGM